MKRTVLILILVLSQGLLYGQRKMTPFDPEKHGFLFENSGFKTYIGDPGSIKIDFSNVCGGMTYAAGDYFYKKITRPDQDYLPAPGTPLYKYLYQRQLKAHENIAGQMAEFTINPGGARNKEFWSWAVGHKLKQVVNNINANRPTPILLLRENKFLTEHHWVMAIGYDLGGYKWKEHEDPNVNNIKIFVYDPNNSQEYMALMPDKAKWNLKFGSYDMETDKFTEKEKWKCTTFHPNTDFYKAVNNPPIIASLKKGNSDMIYRLVAKCITGKDDLRGGNDRVSFRIKYGDGTSEDFPNASLGQRWPNDSEVNVELNLKKNPRISEIRNIEISTNFKGGISSDNWNLNHFTIDAYQMNGEKHDNITGSHSGKPWKRFTGEIKRVELRNTFYKPYKSDISFPKDKVLVSVDLLNITTPVHNDDCRRLQGAINVELRDLNTGKILEGSQLLNWGGNKPKDFSVRNLEHIPNREVMFVMDKATYDKGQFEVILKNSLKRCHKQCDLCSGYHCNVRYNNTSKKASVMKKAGNTYRTMPMLTLQAKAGSKGKKIDDHDMNLDIIIISGSKSGNPKVIPPKISSVKSPPGKIQVAVNLNNLKTPIHNNDCKRLQGSVNIDLRDLKTGKIIKGGSLLNWPGNKSRDFATRNMGSLPKKKVTFLIDKAVYDQKQFEIVVSNTLKRCHKKCDVCSGYHCNIRYNNTNKKASTMKKVGNNYQTTFTLNAKAGSAGKKPDNHHMNLDITVKPEL